MTLSAVQFVLVFGLVGLMAAAAKGDDNDLKEQIKEADAEFTRLWVAEDFEGVSKLYTKDVAFLAPGFPAVHGRSDLVTSFEGLASKEGVKSVTFDEHYIGPEEDDTTYSFGIYHEYDAEGDEILSGHFALIWDLTGERPLRRLNIFN